MLAIALSLIATLAVSDDTLISELALEGKRSDDAYSALLNRGVDAFPALLGRIHDKTVVQNVRFQDAKVIQMADGKSVLAKPTIGDIAFSVIQEQIEDAWPKGFRDHYALTKGNANAWISRHKGIEIRRLRLLATTESLTSLAQDIAKQGFTEHNQRCLEFLTARLQAASAIQKVR